MKFTRKRTDGINHWNESRFANMVQGNHDKPAAPIMILQFADQGQYFRMWTLDAETGEILESQPHQNELWKGKYVANHSSLKPGDKVQISETPACDNPELHTIIFPLSKIIK